MSASAQRGFTLIELMGVLVIMAILLAVAAPNFADSRQSSRLTALSNDFTASTLLARGEAIKRATPVQVCASANASTCATSGDWTQGWVVRVVATGEVLRVRDPGPTGWVMAGSAGRTVTYTASGALSAGSGDLKICQASPSQGTRETRITLFGTGRSLQEKSASTACP